MSNRSILIRESLRRIRDFDDSQSYGAQRDWSYLDDPYELADRRGIVFGQRAA